MALEVMKCEYIIQTITDYLTPIEVREIKNLSRKFYYCCAPKFIYLVTEKTIISLSKYSTDLLRVQRSYRYISHRTSCTTTDQALHWLKSNGQRVRYLDIIHHSNDMIDLSGFPFLESFKLHVSRMEGDDIVTDLTDLKRLKKAEVFYDCGKLTIYLLLPLSIVELSIKSLASMRNLEYHIDGRSENPVEDDFRSLLHLEKLTLWFNTDFVHSVQVPNSLKQLSFDGSQLRICNPYSVKSLLSVWPGFDNYVFVIEDSRIFIQGCWRHVEHLHVDVWDFCNRHILDLQSMRRLRSIRIDFRNKTHYAHLVVSTLQYTQIVFEGYNDVKRCKTLESDIEEVNTSVISSELKQHVTDLRKLRVFRIIRATPNSIIQEKDSICHNTLVVRCGPELMYESTILVVEGDNVVIVLRAV